MISRVADAPEMVRMNVLNVPLVLSFVMDCVKVRFGFCSVFFFLGFPILFVHFGFVVCVLFVRI